jgi:integrase
VDPEPSTEVHYHNRNNGLVKSRRPHLSIVNQQKPIHDEGSNVGFSVRMSNAAKRHPDKALTALQVRNISAPGRYADGNGLYLVVDESGARRWLLRIVVQGRRRDIGLGSAKLVPLAEAREKALIYRKSARDGGDPIVEQRKLKAVVPTFEEAAEKVHAEHSPSWGNKKHGDQWISTLRTYAFPEIGQLRVNQIGTPEVMRVLAPIWLTKGETARRVRQRIGTVLDWARAAGHRDGENPVSGVAKGLPKQIDRDQHHAALPYAEVPAFIKELRTQPADTITLLAFEFLILTASRTGEVIGARWTEVDLEKKIWTVPATRMKAKKEHRVPLSPRCIDLLRSCKRAREESVFVFPGQTADKPISNMAFLMMLRRMKRPVTAHGFRSSFRDWAAEATSYPREVAEMALAHTISNKVEAAYRRGDLLEKRAELMNDWCSYTAGP